MIYVYLFYEFFKTGLFSLGGGLATIPFLAAMGEKYGWFDRELLSNMVAVAESTPGPIGVNAATYVGFIVGGKFGLAGSIFGAVLSTFALVLPSVIIIILVAKTYEALMGNRIVEHAFYAIRPAVTGMIASAALLMIQSALWEGGAFSIKAAVFFAALLVAANKIKLHPIFYIIAAGIVGAVVSF